LKRGLDGDGTIEQEAARGRAYTAGVAETETGIHLAPQAAAELIESGAEAIDVRTDPEWDAARITGARHVEMNDLTAATESIDRERPVVFYCRTGNRSGMAADAFREAGWNAFHVDGGLVAWVEAGLPIEPPDGTVDPQPLR
jgi:rhodanese-related sulfurtransferase